MPDTLYPADVLAPSLVGETLRVIGTDAALLGAVLSEALTLLEGLDILPFDVLCAAMETLDQTMGNEQ